MKKSIIVLSVLAGIGIGAYFFFFLPNNQINELLELNLEENMIEISDLSSKEDFIEFYGAYNQEFLNAYSDFSDNFLAYYTSNMDVDHNVQVYFPEFNLAIDNERYLLLKEDIRGENVIGQLSHFTRTGYLTEYPYVLFPLYYLDPVEGEIMRTDQNGVISEGYFILEEDGVYVEKHSYRSDLESYVFGLTLQNHDTDFSTGQYVIFQNDGFAYFMINDVNGVNEKFIARVFEEDDELFIRYAKYNQETNEYLSYTYTKDGSVSYNIMYFDPSEDILFEYRVEDDKETYKVSYVYEGDIVYTYIDYSDQPNAVETNIAYVSGYDYIGGYLPNNTEFTYLIKDDQLVEVDGSLTLEHGGNIRIKENVDSYEDVRTYLDNFGTLTLDVDLPSNFEDQCERVRVLFSESKLNENDYYVFEGKEINDVETIISLYMDDEIQAIISEFLSKEDSVHASLFD